MNDTTTNATLACAACGGHDVQPGVREGATCSSCGTVQTLHEARTSRCEGCASATPVPEPLYGVEYPFSISDIAHATAARLTADLGDEWTAEAGYWGVTGTISGPCIASFTFRIDYEGDLVIDYEGRYVDDGFPEDPELPENVVRTDDGVALMDACAPVGFDTLAEQSAAAIRAVIGS
ncbi:hypothetical protein [Streptomyces sp. NPDC088707]|uniref:hypothetical protein n=1 Tax=Streptomyces sp. NPDC088707 TaxID=3365871 RepID=UPI0038135177